MLTRHGGCILCALGEHFRVLVRGHEMTNNDWVKRIHRDRATAEEKAVLAVKLRLENRRNYVAKCDEFWSRLVLVVERVVSAYNVDGDPKVQVEKGDTHILLLVDQVSNIDFSIDNEAQQVNVMRRRIRNGMREDQGPTSRQIWSSESGDLIFKGLNSSLDDFVQEYLEPFFRQVNGLS
jgi:hypothetical protein